MRSWTTERTAPKATRFSYRIHRKMATAMRKTITAITARWEISEPQVSDTAEFETPLDGVKAELIAPLAAATWSIDRVAELTWIWLPTVCTESGSIPVADVTTWATSVVEMLCPGLGWNSRVVPPAKSMPNWKPRNRINSNEATTSEVEMM